MSGSASNAASASRRAVALTADLPERPAKESKWPQTLWIVRHGRSASNVARGAAEAAGLGMIEIAERDIDVPLSTLGERQAVALGAWFDALPRGEHPDVVLCSPCVRAHQTALRIQAACRCTEAQCVLDERLREKEFGSLDRLTPLGIRERFPGSRRTNSRRRAGGSRTCRCGHTVWQDPSATLRPN